MQSESGNGVSAQDLIRASMSHDEAARYHEAAAEHHRRAALCHAWGENAHGLVCARLARQSSDEASDLTSSATAYSDAAAAGGKTPA